MDSYLFIVTAHKDPYLSNDPLFSENMSPPCETFSPLNTTISLSNICTVKDIASSPKPAIVQPVPKCKVIFYLWTVTFSIDFILILFVYLYL